MDQSGRFPLSNQEFDIISLLYSKSKALEVLDKYMKDATADKELAEVFSRIRKDEAGHVEELKGFLSKVMKEKQKVS